MARRRSRTQRRSFTPPPLQVSDDALPSHLAALSPEPLWQAGEQAEEEFDYEGARQCYREAVRGAGREVAAFAEKYACFLVERYGQFEEVAAWLDDPTFDPTAGAQPSEAPNLARYVAIAAAETGHPRAGDLDLELAESFGEPDSLSRVAMQRLDAGQRDEAVQLLERYQKRLDPRCEAAVLLQMLREQGDQEVEAALAEATEALQRGDLDAAGQELAKRNAKHSGTKQFKSLAAKLEELRHGRQVASYGQELSSLLARDQLAEALIVAKRWREIDPAGANKTAEVQALIVAREQLGAVATLDQLTPHTPSGWQQLAALHKTHGSALAVGPAWISSWRWVCAAASTGVTAASPPQLALVYSLVKAIEAEDFDAAAVALEDIDARLHRIEPVHRALTALQAFRRTEQERVESQALVQAMTLLADGDLPAAAAICAKHHGSALVLASRWRDLQRDIEQAKDAEQGAQRLRVSLDQAVAAGRWLGAERLFEQYELAGGDSEYLDATREAISKGKERLVAAPVPPFGLSVSDDPVAIGVNGDKLAVVQGRLWLNVNLQTHGLAPFQLPEAYTIDARPTPRLAARGGVLRLVGVSADRLVVVEQSSDGKPTVVAAKSLDNLLRGEKLASLAVEPWASEWQLAGQPTGKKAGRFVRVDPDTLEVLHSERQKPTLSGICAVRHANGCLVATSLDQRMRRGYSMAWLDGAGPPRATWSQEDLDEPIATPTRAIAWPERDLVFASYSSFDPFEPGTFTAQPSLLVLRGLRPVFASSDLRRRFAPIEKITIDHAWTLDPANGRLWFAALPRHDTEGEDALLLGVNARTLRADKPRAVPGVKRIIALEPLADGAAALCKLHDGQFAVARAIAEGDELLLRVDKLPI
jgi:hypothetical protein